MRKKKSSKPQQPMSPPLRPPFSYKEELNRLSTEEALERMREAKRNPQPPLQQTAQELNKFTVKISGDAIAVLMKNHMDGCPICADHFFKMTKHFAESVQK